MYMLLHTIATGISTPVRRGSIQGPPNDPYLDTPDLGIYPIWGVRYDEHGRYLPCWSCPLSAPGGYPWNSGYGHIGGPRTTSMGDISHARRSTTGTTGGTHGIGVIWGPNNTPRTLTVDQTPPKGPDLGVHLGVPLPTLTVDETHLGPKKGGLGPPGFTSTCVVRTPNRAPRDLWDTQMDPIMRGCIGVLTTT
jgi:hypothetical protein